MYIVAGEQLTLRDLLYCAAVSSGNDACNVIASYLGSGIPNFVDRMNERAAELGCTMTRFVDPNGLSNDNLTSPYDLYLITRAAMGYPSFMEICDSTSYNVPATNVNPVRELKNSNALISPDGIYGPGYLYEGAHGIKTGYTRAAGYCLISTAERDDMHLLGIVMGSDGPYLSDTEERKNFSDSAKLYDWAFANFTMRTVIAEDEVLDFADVALAEGDARVGLKPQRSVRFPLPNNVEPGQEDIRIELFDQNLTAPVEAGTVLGVAHVLLAKPAVLTVILVILVLVAAYLALVTRYRLLRRKHLKQRRLAEQRRKELARQRAEEAARAENGTPFDKDLF